MKTIRSTYSTFRAEPNGRNVPITVTLYNDGSSESRDTNGPLSRLRHHVTGAIERGEATPIAGIPSAIPNMAE